MRIYVPVPLGALCALCTWAASLLVACQDSAASNSERETHMGSIHAVEPLSPAPTAPSAPASTGAPQPSTTTTASAAPPSASASSANAHR